MSSLDRRTFCFPKELSSNLKQMAAARGVTVSALVEGILEEALSGSSEKDRLRGIEERLASLDRRLKALRYDGELLGEIFSFYIFQWLCYAPPLPENGRSAIVAEGKERHKRFFDVLAGKLARGEFSLGELYGRDVLTKEPEEAELPKTGSDDVVSED